MTCFIHHKRDTFMFAKGVKVSKSDQNFFLYLNRFQLATSYFIMNLKK
jgi:hypothetical protein